MPVQPNASNQTKEKIIDAAVALFNTQGFNGTSVREIAKKANVNVAHISYYFNGKGGLLEYLVSKYYEGYLSVIETGYLRLSLETPKNCLLLLIGDILNYQHENRQLARFVLREVTLDSMLIREVMTTYLTKEKYFFKAILEEGIRSGQFRKAPMAHILVQLKSLLNMPYLQPQYMSEVLYIQTHESYFVKQYFHEIEIWIDHLLCDPSKKEAIV
ncbi:forespore capture DNA-binding protein RefZ [Metabacillus indicus]|uniref:forespore capture DNA-binding protein RefZ n=1 Tax=Metabacillus indicus TaxID=246786 RepID=UPI002A06DA71|nr:forespore capture DNA-binding protein RefZ [Metabacillus indicus]MDX8290147.1 forespore capture DNA-binding protein RefZ [Metabacillus indicus]